MMNNVVYDASEGYDEEMWDDSELVKMYERSRDSGRELTRTRQEKKTGGGGKKKKSWELGEACRAVFSEDGEEYEGTIVNKNVGNKSVTVRFHGYNNEEEVKISDLMESLGSEAVQEQVEQARLDEEDDAEEEEGVGEEFRLGDWCRAEWSQDGIVYEAVIESLNKKKGTAKVRFIGFNNEEEKHLDELYMSKGEERREEQERIGTEEGDIKEDEIHNLIVKNCPDLLANFGDVDGNVGVEDLDLDKLTIQSKNKKTKKKKSSKEALKSDKSVLIHGEEANINGSHEEETNTKVKKSKKKQSPSVPSSLPSSWDWQTGCVPPVQPMPTFANPMYPPVSSTYPQQLPPYPQQMPPYPQQMPLYPQQMPPFPMPPMHLPMPPSGIPPPPILDGMMEDDQGLHSLLLSWYMAGYQAGLYQQGQNKTRSKKSSKNCNPSN